MTSLSFQSKLSKTANNQHYIPIEEALAVQAIQAFGKRVLCQINGKELHCAIHRSSQLGYYLMIGKKTKKQLALEMWDELEIVLQQDESDYQMAMPEVLLEVLATDPEGMEKFEGLTDGKKRSIMHLINSAKRVDTQINRALKIVENLKRGITSPRDFLK